MLPLRVLYENNHCLAVEKPAGLLTMGDHSGDSTLIDLVRGYLRHKYNKPGQVFVGLIHRLDRLVSGVVLFARTSKGASRLSEQFRTRTVEKTYLALVEGTVVPQEGLLQDRLLKNRSWNLVSVVDEDSDGQDCSLQYTRVGTHGRFTLLKNVPQTGSFFLGQMLPISFEALSLCRTSKCSVPLRTPNLQQYTTNDLLRHSSHIFPLVALMQKYCTGTVPVLHAED